MRPTHLLAALFFASEATSYTHYTETNFKAGLLVAGEQRRSKWSRYHNNDSNTRRRGQDTPVDPATNTSVVDILAPSTAEADPVVPEPVIAEPVIADPVVPDPFVLDPVVPDPVVPDPMVPDPVIPDPANPINGEVDPAHPADPIDGEVDPVDEVEQIDEEPVDEEPVDELPEDEGPEEEAPEEGDDGLDGGLIGDLNDSITTTEGQNIADILLGNGNTKEENFESGTRPAFDDHTGCDGKDPCCRWYYISEELTGAFVDADGTCNALARQSIRMGFHDAGTWSMKLAAAGQDYGGADGSLVLFDEIKRPENFGLESAVGLAQQLYNKYNVTMADLIQYMANHAVVSCPLGPRVRTYVGRIDATQAAPDGLLPNVHAPADELIALFADKTISAHELTALMGAHSTSTQKGVDGSKAGYPQDTTPGVWDVKYYNETLDATENNCIFKFESDVKLSKHPTMSSEWQKFVGDQGHWNGDYARAYLRLSLLGVKNINELKECTLTLPAQQGTVPKTAEIGVNGKCKVSSSSSLISSSTNMTPNATSSMPIKTTDTLVLWTETPIESATSTVLDSTSSTFESTTSVLNETSSMAPDSSTPVSISLEVSVTTVLIESVTETPILNSTSSMVETSPSSFEPLLPSVNATSDLAHDSSTVASTTADPSSSLIHSTTISSVVEMITILSATFSEMLESSSSIVSSSLSYESVTPSASEWNSVIEPSSSAWLSLYVSDATSSASVSGLSVSMSTTVEAIVSSSISDEYSSSASSSVEVSSSNSELLSLSYFTASVDSFSIAPAPDPSSSNMHSTTEAPSLSVLSIASVSFYDGITPLAVASATSLASLPIKLPYIESSSSLSSSTPGSVESDSTIFSLSHTISQSHSTTSRFVSTSVSRATMKNSLVVIPRPTPHSTKSLSSSTQHASTAKSSSTRKSSSAARIESTKQTSSTRKPNPSHTHKTSSTIKRTSFTPKPMSTKKLSTSVKRLSSTIMTTKKNY